MEAVWSVGNFQQSLLAKVSQFCLERGITFDLNGYEEKNFDSEFRDLLFGQNSESDSNCKVGKKRQIDHLPHPASLDLGHNQFSPLQLAHPLSGERSRFARGDKGIILQPSSGDQGYFEVELVAQTKKTKRCFLFIALVTADADGNHGFLKWFGDGDVESTLTGIENRLNSCDAWLRRSVQSWRPKGDISFAGHEIPGIMVCCEKAPTIYFVLDGVAVLAITLPEHLFGSVLFPAFPCKVDFTPPIAFIRHDLVNIHPDPSIQLLQRTRKWRSSAERLRAVLENDLAPISCEERELAPEEIPEMVRPSLRAPRWVSTIEGDC